jgi:hypothetical protein
MQTYRCTVCGEELRAARPPAGKAPACPQCAAAMAPQLPPDFETRMNYTAGPDSAAAALETAAVPPESRIAHQTAGPVGTAPYTTPSLICGILGVVGAAGTSLIFTTRRLEPMGWGVLGAACMGLLLGIAAFAMGRASLGCFRRTRGLYTGAGLARAGMVLGVLAALVGAAWTILFIVGPFLRPWLQSLCGSV